MNNVRWHFSQWAKDNCTPGCHVEGKDLHLAPFSKQRKIKCVCVENRRGKGNSLSVHGWGGGNLTQKQSPVKKSSNGKIPTTYSITI